MLRSIRPILLLGALALALAAAGCGSDDASDASDPAASQSQQDNEQDTARAKLEQCLRDNGVELPRGGEGDPPATELSEAERNELMEAIQGPCAEYRDDAIGDVSPEEEQERQDARVKFQDCMRDHGIEIESGGAGFAQIDPNDPDVQEAFEACQEQVPEFGAAGRGGGGG